MGDDYVTLIFSVAKPIYFRLGDYVDIVGFGRFELITPYQPTYNAKTNGYDYELRLDAQHMKWRNKIMRYMPKTGNSECAWSLTTTADVHMAQVLENIEALVTETLMNGDKVINQQYLYNGTTRWAVFIDDSVEASAKTINYNSTNIIDALTAIAEIFECEWWVNGNIICLGKCEESNEYVDLEIGENVASMTRQDSSEDYVTRILAFGSERNISPRYRKDLIFDVKATENGGNRISDTSRPIEVEWFDSSMVETSSDDNNLKRVKGIKIELIGTDGTVTNTLNGAIFNPDYKSGAVDRNWIQLPDGAVMQTGQRFRITNIIESKVKSSYFSSLYSAYDDISNVVRNGVVTSRLMLPISHGTPYIDFKPSLSMEEGVEDVVIFEDVYPRAICAITGIDTVQRKETIQNDDGTTTETTFTAYQIKDDFFTSAHQFENDYIVPNCTLKIEFQDGKRYKEGDTIPAGKKTGDLINPESGKLNGWTFEVQFIKDEDGSAIWEIKRDNTAFVPNEILHPEIGDQFVLTGFDISVINDLYVNEAEKELLEKATKYLNKLNTDPSTYNCTMMPDAMKSGLTLGLGKRVNLINEAYIESTIDANGRKWGRRSRVIGYEIPLDIPYDNPIYIIGEKAAYSRFGEIEDKIDALKFSMTAPSKNYLGGSSVYYGEASLSSSNGGIYVIKQTDITPASETNVFSALRSCLEFTSKKTKEIINYLWTFMQGIRIGNYVMSNDGAKIDPNGDAEFGDVVIRKGVSVGEDLNVGGDAELGDVVIRKGAAIGENLNINGDATVGNGLNVRKGITIGDYQPGAYGGRIMVDDLGKVHIETDYLDVRETFKAKEVEIQEQTHVGGCQIISPAAMRCSRVIPIYNDANSVIAYKCFFTAEDDAGTHIYNQFEVSDLARCETFNLTKQSNGKLGNHYFWRKVLEVGYVNKDDVDFDENFGIEGYITLSNLPKEKDAASDIPMAGDRIITVGNDDPAKVERSNLIILASYGSGSPYIYQYKGINTFALTKDKLKTAISPSGNLFTGRFVIENGAEEVDVIDYIENNIYLEAYQLILSNEMAGVPCDSDGNVIGDLPSSKITIYKGKTVEAGWTLKCETVGCVAAIVSDHVYLSELIDKNATVTIIATKTGCPTLTKIMNVCKLKEGEMGTSGSHAVQFEIEPDKTIILVDMDGKCDPAKLGCKVYMVIGNQNRVEVPLANTAAITTYKAGDKLLFFNGRLFVNRPVEVDVPTDLVLHYTIVNQDYQTDKSTGKITPIISSETEHIYTGTPITTTKRMKHIIFKLYRGNTLVDMQTIIVTTDASAMKVVYDTRFEVNEKEILAHASRISQNEQSITDLRISADGISANIGKHSEIIQDIVNGAGRNLLLRTSDSDIWSYTSDSASNASKSYPAINPDNATAFAIAPRTDSTFEIFYYPIRPELIKEGKMYTFSLNLRNTMASQGDVLELYAVIANIDSSGALTKTAYFDKTIGDGEYYLTVQLEATATGSSNGSQVLILGVVLASVNRWTNIQLWHPKLEKGTTATAYSEAPEDREDYLYSELNAKIDLTAEGLRSEVTKKISETESNLTDEISDAENRITSQYTSLIEQRADKILAQVEGWDEELGASISKIQQTANSVSLKVDELAGYENLITGNSTGRGWSISGDDGAFDAVEPVNGIYHLTNETKSPKYLRTSLFTLKPNTKYTLSFFCSTTSLYTIGLDVNLKYGDTAIVLTSRTYQGSAINGIMETKTFTFTTGDNAIENVFVEFAHLGITLNTQTVLNISHVILEEGVIAHSYVEDNTGLLATGIDIYNRRIIFTADNILFQTNSGERSMLIDENGHILTKFINAEELMVRHLVAGDENGQRVEIDPELKSIEIYDENNGLCTTVNGVTHGSGVEDLYKDSQTGTINTTTQSEDSYAISSGSITLNGDTSRVLKNINIYSEVWKADTPTGVIMGVGNLEVTCYAAGYTESKNNTSTNGSSLITPATISSASGYIYLTLEVAEDENFTKNKKTWTIHNMGASASAALQSSSDISNSEPGGNIFGNYHPSDLKVNTSILDGKSAKSITKGYCRLCMCLSATVYHEGSYVTFKWGHHASSGRDLAATWKNEFYISNFFANGFCLGIRKDKYIIAYKDESDNMHFEMEEEGFGLKFSQLGIQTKHHNGNWMKMPMLVWKAKIRRYSTSGDNSDKYYIDFQKSFNSDTISWTNVIRSTPSSNHIHVYIPFPTSWQALEMSDNNTIVNLNGYGDMLIKGTLVNISSAGMTVELSDDSTANDGTLLIELFIL